MATALKLSLFSSVLVSLFLLSSAQSCLKYKFAGKQNFTFCNDLPYLNSYIHYTHNADNNSLTFAYRHTGITNYGKWVAWAINPVQAGMEHAETFVAYPRGDGSLYVYATILLGLKPTLLEVADVFKFWNLSATYANNEIVIFAVVGLPENRTIINQLWQEGLVSQDVPGMHETAVPNLMSMGTLNLLTGQATFNKRTPVSSVDMRTSLHATFCVVGWGIMMPIGSMLGRYLKVIESAEDIWLCIHVTWQLMSYVVGVTGWALGFLIRNTIRQTRYKTHRLLGYILFFLATLQVLAFLIKPKKDHKYRYYWALYHKIVGYAIVLIGIINVFVGFTTLLPLQKWTMDYFGTIFILFLIGIVLEVYTQKLKEKRNQLIGVIKQPHIQLGSMETHGYEGRDRYGL